MGATPSVLYYIPPRGLGTVEVESLESYVARLASEHSVSQFALLEFLIGSRRARNKYDGRFLLHRDLLISALINATGCEQVGWTSLSRWKDVLSFNYLFAKARRWCPLCREEDGASTYDRLIWSLRDVTICYKHQINLIGIDSMACEPPDASEREWQFFVHRQLSLLLRQQELSALPKQSFRRFIVEMTSIRPWILMKFNFRHSLCDLLLKGWLKEGALPTLHSALVLSYFCRIPLVELYTSPPQISEILNSRPELYMLAAT